MDQKSLNNSATGSVTNLADAETFRYPWRFSTMFDPVLDFLCSVDRPAAYYKVFFACVKRLRPDEPRSYSATEVAADCGISKSTAERVLVMLEADCVLMAGGSGSAKKRRLNHRVIWRDRVVTFNEEHNMFPDPLLRDGTKMDRFPVGLQAAT
ncbi:MAG: hypothetical protein HRT64_12820 [Erythrobacter sp.]|nr:hypothetical protein [Erythrobacter sp.]